jgi:hypothetical protein
VQNDAEPHHCYPDDSPQHGAHILALEGANINANCKPELVPNFCPDSFADECADSIAHEEPDIRTDRGPDHNTIGLPDRIAKPLSDGESHNTPNSYPHGSSVCSPISPPHRVTE